jgi:hypothetical protein
MITEFSYFNNNGIVIPISIKDHPNVFIDVKDDLFNKFHDGSKKGLSWKYQDKKISLHDPKVSVIGFPSVDNCYIIAVYQGVNGQFSPPNNAVIYNLDGKIYKILEMPKLMSKEILSTFGDEQYSNPPLELAKYEGGLQFNGFGWREDQSGKLVNFISILYDKDWWESRLINPETGVIGDLLASGRI